jgi:hypothetical protein
MVLWLLLLAGCGCRHTEDHDGLVLQEAGGAEGEVTACYDDSSWLVIIKLIIKRGALFTGSPSCCMGFRGRHLSLQQPDAARSCCWYTCVK